MVRIRYESPTNTFPYKISRRLNLMSYPRPVFEDPIEGLPGCTPGGVRKSALTGHFSDRINDASLPYIRRFLTLKRQFKNRFSEDRLQRIDRMMEATNVTLYAKLANCVMDLKKNAKDPKKRRAWSDAEWKKHMDYINLISKPKPNVNPLPYPRGDRKPLDDLLPRIEQISKPTEFKIYKRMSKDIWYKNPEKVAPNALKYVATERVKVLARPKPTPQSD